MGSEVSAALASLDPGVEVILVLRGGAEVRGRFALHDPVAGRVEMSASPVPSVASSEIVDVLVEQISDGVE